MIPLYLDEDSSRHSLARALRASGIDVVTTLELGRLEADDEDQLQFAASNHRAIYTANVADYSRLHSRWLRHGRHHAGIIALPQQRTPIGAQIRALTSLVRAHSRESIRNNIEYLSRWL